MGVKLITFFSKSWVRRVIEFRYLLRGHSSIITTSPISYKLLFLSALTDLLSFLVIGCFFQVTSSNCPCL